MTSENIDLVVALHSNEIGLLSVNGFRKKISGLVFFSTRFLSNLQRVPGPSAVHGAALSAQHLYQQHDPGRSLRNRDRMADQLLVSSRAPLGPLAERELHAHLLGSEVPEGDHAVAVR